MRRADAAEPAARRTSRQSESGEPQRYRFTPKRSLNSTLRTIDEDYDFRVLARLELGSVLDNAPKRELRAAFLDLRNSDNAPESGQTNVALSMRVSSQDAGD